MFGYRVKRYLAVPWRMPWWSPYGRMERTWSCLVCVCSIFQTCTLSVQHRKACYRPCLSVLKITFFCSALFGKWSRRGPSGAVFALFSPMGARGLQHLYSWYLDKYCERRQKHSVNLPLHGDSPQISLVHWQIRDRMRMLRIWPSAACSYFCAENLRSMRMRFVKSHPLTCYCNPVHTLPAQIHR